MEWTKEAKRIFESHVRGNQTTWKKAGADVAEVTDDLRDHVEEAARAEGARVVDAQNVSGVLRRFQLTWETETLDVLTLTGWGKVLKNIYLLFGVWVPLLFVGVVLKTVLTANQYYQWPMFLKILFDGAPRLWNGSLGLAVYLLFIFLMVPVANWGVWRTIKYKMTDRKKAVEWLGGVAAAMSFVSLAIGFMFLGRLSFVQFLLVLVPLSAFAVLVRYSIYFTERLGTPLIYWKGIVLGVILLLLPFAVSIGFQVPALSTAHGLRLIAENDGPDTPGVRWLRRWGSRKVLTELCYSEWAWATSPEFNRSRFAPSIKRFSPKQLQDIYFQVYGFPVTQAALPKSLRGIDPNRGGERVGPLDPMISLVGSRLDVDVDSVVGVSRTRWTLEVENKGSNLAEARCEVVLPRGGVVTDAGIWMNGKEVPAEFWARAAARAAYERVVRQRRDPLLITTVGQGRVLVQFFPIPPRGERLKIRFDISAPLEIDGGQGVYRAPVIEDRNFVILPALQRTTHVNETPKEAEKNRFIYAAETAAPEKIVVQESAPLNSPALSNPFDNRFAVVKQIASDEGPRERVVVVVDTSVSMKPYRRALQRLLNKFPRSYTLVYPKGDLSPETVEGAPGKTPSLPGNFSGGRDNYWALIKGWSLTLESPRGALIWIHGPQPVSFFSPEIFYQRREHDTRAPVFYDVPVTNGPNIYLEKFQDLFQPEILPWDEEAGGPLAARLSELSSPHFSRTQVFFSTAPVKKGSNPAPRWARETAARLWASEEIGRELGSGNRDRVELLTRTYSILHRESAAVALETEPMAFSPNMWRPDFSPTVNFMELITKQSTSAEKPVASQKIVDVDLQAMNRSFANSDMADISNVRGSLAMAPGVYRYASRRKSVVPQAWLRFLPWLILLLFLAPMVAAVVYFRARRRAVRPVFRLEGPA